MEWLLTTVSALQDRGFWTDPDALREIQAEAEQLKHDFRHQQEAMRMLAERLEALSVLMSRILAEMPSKPDSESLE